jgi:solute carrier family 25 protein 42
MASDHDQQRLRATGHGVLNHLLGGACGGAVGKTITAPLDRVKIIYQTGRDRFNLRRSLATVHHIASHEGLSALWRGHTATLARVAPYAGMHFAAHDALDRALEQRLPGVGSAQTARRFVAGAGAGVFATATTYPLDVLRARFAVQRGRSIRLRDALRGNLYSGVGPTMMGIVPYAGITWATYLALVDVMPESDRFWAGAVAGLAGQTVTYPLDVARRRMQTGATGSAMSVLRQAWLAEGPRALFKGVSLAWCKGPPASAAAFAVHEQIASSLDRAFEQGRSAE